MLHRERSLVKQNKGEVLSFAITFLYTRFPRASKQNKLVTKRPAIISKYVNRNTSATKLYRSKAEIFLSKLTKPFLDHGGGHLII